MKLKALIAQYGAFRKSLGARFEHTEGRLNAFCRWMGEITVTDVHAERVNAFLAGTGPVTRSWQERYGLLNGLYRYAISRGLVVTSPLPTTMPKLPERFVLLLFLYNTGARADEAAQLTIGNVELAQTPTRGLSSVQIHGKGNKLRRCPLWPHTASALTALLNDRPQHEHVFLSRCGRPITRFGIHTMVERYVKRVSAKLPALSTKRVSPHSLRHTTATHLLRAGVDINTIRRLAGPRVD